ncbi:MAG: hypothetical protein R3D02_03310 [Hyphomicrobiales bacterium]
MSAAFAGFSRARSLVRTIVGLTVGLLVAGCLRPEGDFGRPRPSFINDTVAPVIGLASASARGEPVSPYNLTDDERELRDLSWSIVRPPHALDWAGASLAELQRTRILGPVDLYYDPRLYYGLLRLERFKSSEARYARVADDALADADGVKPFYAAACRVFAADEERMHVAGRLQNIPERSAQFAAARVEENRNVVAWGWRALQYRLAAYRYALDRLQIETPSLIRVAAVNQSIDALAWHVEDSEGLARCTARAERFAERPVIPGRALFPDDAGVKK